MTGPDRDRGDNSGPALADRTASARAAAARTAAALNPRPSRVRPYQRRRRGPVIVVVGFLAVAAIATWVTVLSTAADRFGNASCPPPVAGPAPGTTVDRDAFYAATPAPLAAVRVHVFNAGGQRGQANLVAAELGDLGFTEAAPPDNDTFYPDGDMDCAGQLRYGPAGESAANTLALVLPCVELIRDERADDVVDVSVGTAFGDINPPRPVRDALDQLGETQGGSDGTGNADPSAQETAPAPVQTVDPTLLQQARDTLC